ncbi:protein kinase domain-containing protein [Photobacterium swingsii]|uniref:protein kinase domain-containing protein n=1 Tax=Photobacterium swingsii TaxID=680026 RepID=UPI00406844F0
MKVAFQDSHSYSARVMRPLTERFELIKTLSNKVWLAHDRQADFKPVVIKQGDGDQLEREWCCLNQCRSHYFRQPVEWLEDEQLLILEYIEGDSLLSLQQDQATLFLSLMPQIVRAIRRIHQQGWVHGDIKPSNVLLDKECQTITIIDFGAALPMNTVVNTQSSIQLTLGFCTQSRTYGHHRVSEKDDWYSLQQWLLQLKSVGLPIKDVKQVDKWLAWLHTMI